MATLKELIDTHGLPLKVVRCEWTKDESYFEAVATSSEDAVGFYKNGEGAVYNCYAYNLWSLYTEPKPKVKRWLWAEENEAGVSPRYRIAGIYSEEEAKHKSFLVKLLFSEQEFEA
jgi:hypothetical protein